MEPKASVFGRLWQSFKLFKGNFLKLWLPIFVYNFVSFALVWSVITFFIFWMLKNLSIDTLDPLAVYSNPKVIIATSLGIIAFIAYLLLYIPVTLWLLKWIKQSINWKNITLVPNVSYWFSRLFLSFKTYWYIFSYVALIPALFFICWGILVIVWMKFWINVLLIIWWGLLSIAGLVFFLFALIRWIKSIFALYSAVDDDEFTKENFLFSIKSTDNNWWRILWNFIVFWIIIWVISFVTTLIFAYIPFSSFGNTDLQNTDDLSLLIENFSVIPYIVWSFFQLIISTIIVVFASIFIYLFFLTLKNESWRWNQPKNSVINNPKEIDNDSYVEL